MEEIKKGGERDTTMGKDFLDIALLFHRSLRLRCECGFQVTIPTALLEPSPFDHGVRRNNLPTYLFET